MPIPLLIGAGLVAQGISSLFGAAKGAQALKRSKKIKPDYFAYGDSRLQGAESPYAKQMLGLAQTQLNARSPLAAARERALLGSQANAMAGVQRAVTDPSQALAMTAAISAQTDQAISNQFMQEEAMKQQRMANLMNAQNVMIREGDKVYQDRMNKFMMDQQRKDALQQAGSQTIMNAGSNLASTLFSAYGATKGIFPTGGGKVDYSNAIARTSRPLMAPAMSRTVTANDYPENPFG